VTSSGLFEALGAVTDAVFYDEAFGLLEAARNFSRDCAPPDAFDEAFAFQLSSQLSKYSQPCISWFAENEIVPGS
jgi:hypothetical protein